MLRPFDPDRDRAATHRIWRETGWLDAAKSEEKEQTVDRWVDAGLAYVAEIDGEAECLVCSAPGTIGYQRQELPLCCITGVTTSRVARRKGYALKLTAMSVAAGARAGAEVTGLGMFEQGFYNRVGFGTGAYGVTASFDPARLAVRASHRTPTRLSAEDWHAVHQARMKLPARHGQCKVDASITTRALMEDGPHRFGLGYRDSETGEITHHFWCVPRGEFGPYRLDWVAFHTGEQFLELMALLKSLGDQVRLVKMNEPPGIQLQDMMHHPFNQMRTTDRSDFAATITAKAAYQFRICNLEACIGKSRLPGPEVRFNLTLADPIAAYIEDGAPWRGCGGDYIVTLGPSSGAEPGSDASLPTIMASVGAFTRMWLGVRPPTCLAITDDLQGPQQLLEQLDDTLRLPVPINDWEF